MSFASDNNAGVSEQVINALRQANESYAISYGSDIWTEKAYQAFHQEFGDSIDIYFVNNGTAANVLALSAYVQSYHAVICSRLAHMAVDECGAPEAQLGVKLMTLPTLDGKITALQVEEAIHGLGVEHHAQIRGVSVTQPTELGQLYTLEEIKEISRVCRRHGLFLHMDGARISNAAVALNLSLRQVTRDCGVDVLSLGGTKNGLMGAEAVVFFDPAVSKDFKFRRKQSMQLQSKMRFLSAQFLAFFENEHWKVNARVANQMAKYLEDQVRELPRLKIVHPASANALFVQLPKSVISALQNEFFFYVWDEKESIVRWMTSFRTTQSEVDRFVERIRELLV